MGLRFRKSVRLLPGVKINLSKSGISTSVGKSGATVNIGRRGVRGTVGMPGTGLSYSTTLAKGGKGARGRPRISWAFIIVVAIIIAAWMLS